MPKVLIAVGALCILLGVLWQLGVPFGRLPGDFTLKRGSTTIYIPIASSIVVSLLLTLLATLFRR